MSNPSNGLNKQSTADLLGADLFAVITTAGKTDPNPQRIFDLVNEGGANVNYVDPATGQTILDATLLRLIAEGNSSAPPKNKLLATACIILLQNGAHLGAMHGQTTVAHLLVAARDETVLLKMVQLQKNKPNPVMDINTPVGSQQNTPLHLAIIMHELKLVEILAAKGDANIEAVNTKGQAPLALFDDIFSAANAKDHKAKPADIARARKLLGPDNPRVKALKKAWDDMRAGFPADKEMTVDAPIIVTKKRLKFDPQS